MKSYISDHVAFIEARASDLDYWEDQRTSKGAIFPKVPTPTTYVSQSDLQTCAECLRKRIRLQDTIWKGSPGFMSSGWVHKYAEPNRSFRFAAGCYARTDSLLLVDDVFQWAHRRLDSKDVRTCSDIIWKLAGRKGPTAPLWQWYTLK